MSSISSFLNPYASAASTNLTTVLSSSAVSTDDDPAADAVLISDEAIELLNELTYKENQSSIKTENEFIFDKVSKKLPATDGFTDMLEWLSSQKEEASFSIGGDIGDSNRDAYEKDPYKYAELWNNLYNDFSGLMETLGLDGDDTMMREVLANEDVQLELMSRFKTSFSDETNSLLSYFNIVV